MGTPPIIIAGLGSAGYAALMTLKRIDPKVHIVVIDPKRKDIVHPCGLPYALEGVVDEKQLEQDILLSRMNVEKIVGTIHRIDATKKEVVIYQDNDYITMPFSKIIVSTGYKPILPPIANIERYLHEGVYTLCSIDDLLRIKKELHQAQTVVVIGAGAIGLEVAYALSINGLTVTVIEAKEILQQMIDNDMALMVTDYLARQNIGIVQHSPVISIEKCNGKFELSTTDRKYTADIVILATGFAPNCVWAENSGFARSQWGVIVDEHLEVQKDIYAAGDCIQSWSVIDKKPVGNKLATSAYKQGIVAAENVMGIPSVYQGTTGAFVTKIGEMEVAAVGFTTNVAKDRGFSVVTGKISSTIKPDYFPKNEHLTFKIVCDTNGKIIGAQAVGSGAASRINIVSFAIQNRLSVDELIHVELTYCPAVSEVHDIVCKASEFAKRRLK